MKKHLILLFMALLAFPAVSQTEDEGEGEFIEVSDESEAELSANPITQRYRLGNGLRFTLPSGNRLTLNALIQTTADVRRYEGVDKTFSRFRMRRARLGFAGHLLNDKLRVRLTLDLVKGSETDEDNGTLLQDAYLTYRPWGQKLQISFGQKSTPTDNLELMMGSHTLQFADRSKLSSAFGTIRELGVFVESSLNLRGAGVLRPRLAVTDGDGPIGNFDRRYGGLKYGARVSYLPLGTFRNYGVSREGDMAYEFDPKLSVGVAYSYADGTSDRRGGRSNGDILYKNDKDRIDLPDYGKLTADVLFKYRGFTLLGEFAKTWGYVPKSITQRVRNDGTTSTKFDVDGEQNIEGYIKNRMMLGEGYNIQAGYMLRSMWSFDLRYTHIRPDKYSFLHNDLYFNRHNFYDVSVAKYLARNYAVKVQLTAGLARSAGENRTPDGNYTWHGNEWTGSLMVSFKL